MYLLLDASGRVVDANAYAQQILPDTLPGAPFRDFILAFTQDLDPVQAGQAGKTFMPLSIATRCGVPRTFYWSFRKDEEHIHVFGEECVDEVDVLQKNLIDTNIDLSNMTRQLHKANSELRKLHDVKNHFLGMAAHDLRNPIGAIMGFSNFLLEEAKSLTLEQQEFLQIIKSSSRYMLGLLDNLLDIAKIESGRLDLDLKRTDFLELIRQNIKLNKVLADKKGIRLALHVHEQIPPLMMDALKIEQVLNNLLSNALKFSLSGTVVTIRLFMSGRHLTVEIRDQGHGIPRDKLDQIFKPFTRISAQGTAGERTTGLGLAIVQKIVLGHRGRIWVESVEGEGSAFYFTLPAAQGAEEEAAC